MSDSRIASNDGVASRGNAPAGSRVLVRVERAGAEATLHDFALRDPIWIGRVGCEITLDAPTVSRRHAVIEEDTGGLRIADVSSNGLRINGEHVTQASVLVKDGARLEVGPFSIVVKLSASSEPPASRVTVSVTQRRLVHRALLDHLDLTRWDGSRADLGARRPAVIAALELVVARLRHQLPTAFDERALVQELADEALGLGPLERLLADDSVSEIMVVDPETIFAERGGRLERTTLRFTDDDAVRAVIERIVTPLGRRIDESTPMVDARLPDGSRVNAVIPPLAIKGAAITIRRFAKTPLTMDDLVRYGALHARVATLLQRLVRARKNILVAGGTGSGKTTLLNVLAASIDARERVVTIEDAAELRLQQPHVVALESRPANMEGKGAFSIRDLVRNALRMRPDRIVVGECRAGEALDMLQAMNTGHEGSMTTLHANSPREAIARLETLCLMSGLDLPLLAIRAQIAASVHVVVQQTRFADGSRRVTSVSEVLGLEPDGSVRLQDIFRFQISAVDAGPDGEDTVRGELRATGFIPSFMDELVRLGLMEDGASL